MKRIAITFLLLALCSCSKNKLDDAPLDGEWILTNVACFCYFEEDYDFTTSSIIFDVNNNQITVKNEGELTFLRESGTYSYSGKENEISFDNNKSYTFSIEDSVLTLNYIDEPNIADDEVSYIYRKK